MSCVLVFQPSIPKPSRWKAVQSPVRLPFFPPVYNNGSLEVWKVAALETEQRV